MPGWSTEQEYEALEKIQRDQEGLGQPDFPFQEPNGLDEIRALRPSGPRQLDPLMRPEQWLDKFQGAWLGRCVGCALGWPIEGDPFASGGGGRPGWKNIQLWFQGAGAYPIRGYTPEHSSARKEFGLTILQNRLAATREHLKFMISDDDIRYTVLGLKMLETHGDTFDSWDVGKFWHQHLPYAAVCTAETQAYLNFAQVTNHLHGERPSDWREKLDWVRTHQNPYREWIGAQIRVDGLAYGAAGYPEKAASLAWQDASFSHVKNGVYGAMYTAALIAAAFVESDPEALVSIGLSEIPSTCRLAADVDLARSVARNARDQLQLVAELHEAFGHYHWIHTNNNAALVTAALLWGEGDFEKTVTTAVLGGWDTDCNGATTGSILGALLGAQAIPVSWTQPLNDTLYSEIPGFHPISIRECGRRSFEVFHRLHPEAIRP